MLILEAGARYSAGLAQWVHDHEAPVLVFFCSLGLIGLRQAILAWANSREEGEGEAQNIGGVRTESPGYESFTYSAMFDHEGGENESASVPAS
jgi:hypothetical protein